MWSTWDERSSVATFTDMDHAVAASEHERFEEPSRSDVADTVASVAVTCVPSCSTAHEAPTSTP